MKITVDPKVLADAVAWTARALPNRPSVPVLAGLLLAADADGLTLSAFDYDTSRQATTACDVAEPGRVLLPGRILAEITKSLPNKPVELALDGAEVTLTCGPSEFTLLTMPVDDYPKMPETPEEIGTVDTQQFAGAVAQAARGTSGDDTLPAMTCIRVDIAGEEMTLASTDRYRMVSRVLGWTPDSSDAAAEVLIPGGTLQEIVKSMPPGGVTIGLSDGLAAIWAEGRRATVRLIDESFPDVKKFLDGDYSIWAELNVTELAAAIKRVAVMAERNSPIRLAFTDGQVVVHAGGNDGGRAAEVLDADLSGKDIDIAFNHLYLLDGLAGVEGGRVRIGMTEPAKPALVTGVAEGDPDYRYLIMPIRAST